MKKENILKNISGKFDGELLKIITKHIDNYFKLDELNYKIKNKYKVGDNVILDTNNLLHGIRNRTDLLDIFSKRGIVSNDYLTDETASHAFIYNSGFWSVNDKIQLKDYIINYSGVIAKYDDTWEQVPYKGLDNFVEKMRKSNAWLWTAESSMEIRFMPSLSKDDNQLAFILNVSHPLAKKMKGNSIFKNKKLEKYRYSFIHEKAIKDFENGFKLDAFERADYIIFGFPKNCIEGVLVGRKYENDESKIKHKFSNCYICNLDGIVIM